MTVNKPGPLPDEVLSEVAGGVFVQTGSGNDTLSGTGQNDVIFSGAGNDWVNAGPGDDQVYGEAGNDMIHAGAGNDLAFGGDGNDTLNGGSGQDQLQGGAGDDLLDGGAGDAATDLAFGGAGNDTFLWAAGDGSDQVQGGAGQDTLRLHGVSLQQLTSALRLEGGDTLKMQVSSSTQGNVVTFVDAAGNPATFQGTVSIGGETLRFSEIERIAL
jgi:Ca2+-binding RTX toxin-like protein